jgi:hypothetical protein
MSDDSIALDRIRSSPLEHAFGNMRIRCRDVHTLEKMIAVFTSIKLASVVPSLLNLQRIPRRHLSMGVRCESFIHSEHSIFTLGPKAIAIVLFLCTGIDLSRIDVGPRQIAMRGTNFSKSMNFVGGWAQGKLLHRMNLYFTRDQGRCHQIKSFSEFQAPVAVLI